MRKYLQRHWLGKPFFIYLEGYCRDFLPKNLQKQSQISAC